MRSDDHPPPPEFSLDVLEDAGQARRLVVAGELDLETAPRLREAVASHDGDRPVVVDLAGVSFVDSSGLQALLTVARDSPGAHVALARPSEAVRRLVRMTALEPHLRWADGDAPATPDAG